jgi:hypothetical protein
MGETDRKHGTQQIIALFERICAVMAVQPLRQLWETLQSLAA